MAALFEAHKRLDVSTLSEDECEAILKVIQRDFDLRQNEQERLQWVLGSL